ncbi:hypothetical protein Celly_0924 [Cellulophaga lytica DSM 7489]|uniref:Uncharacterized protein n=1 Tax=Cellulophaga lytica (strain ATCC 23178 / DSM 7489 / JCM 8516 / NBRC 14961 / NCIMB 1423 / VKM B-1433 / Cy l20) TaxID=867900 RepID=F0RDK7_CELLC|nr:hypothetical protein Celly_0924 [Cellulophaga lytica DSM 7489]
MSEILQIKGLSVDELRQKAIEIGKQLDGLSVNQSNYVLQLIKQEMSSNSFIRFNQVLGLEQHLQQMSKED